MREGLLPVFIVPQRSLPVLVSEGHGIGDENEMFKELRRNCNH